VKPPICCICERRFDINEGGLIYFKKRESDIEWDKRMRETGGKGHPPYAGWFCGLHYEKARSFSHLTIDKACAKIREESPDV
jgi:hypothetical protein